MSQRDRLLGRPALQAALPGPWRQLVWLVLGAAFCQSACNIEGNVGGLADTLLDPEPSSIDSPGRQIAQGEYTSLELDASLSVGARLLALRHDREQTELSVIPFEGGQPCHVGPITRFMRLASQVDIDLPPLVAVLNEVQNGRGQLRFVDFSCNDVMDELEDVSLPQVLYPRSKPTGFLVLSGSGAIYFLNVVEHELSVVSESVRSGRVGSEHLWLVEGGQLNARDDNFDIAASYGTDVQDFALFSGLSERGATDIAFIEGGNLFLASGLDGEPQQLAENVCALTDIGHAGAFAFYSPCETRRLSIAYKGSLAGLDDESVVVTHLAEQVLDLRQIDLYWGEGHGAALFITNADATLDRGTLQLQAFSAETGEVEEATELAQNAHISSGGVIRIDYTGSSGTLMRAKLEVSDDGRPELQSLEPLAAGVAQLPGVTVSSSLGVLANYDDANLTGELVLFSADLEQEPSVLAEGVPIQRHVRDANRQRSAFVGDFNGKTGTAYVLEGKNVMPLGNRVQPGTPRFLDMPHALAYLTSPAAGRDNLLTLYLLDAEIEVNVNAGVTEFHGLPWPSPGILYSVAEGANQGIWFARAR